MRKPRPANSLRWLGAALLALTSAAPAHAGEWEQRHRELHAAYRVRLGQLADWCEKKGLDGPTKLLRTWLPADDRFALTVFVIDDLRSPDDASGDAGEVDWRKYFTQIRTRQAEALFALAEQAADAEQPALAMRLATEAVRENPDHQQARRVLGYVRHGDHWQTATSKRKLEAGNVWHPRFGWLQSDDVSAYEQGQRRHGNRWVDAEEDARLHRSMDNGWQVRTDHYTVTTNHSLEAGVQLAARLERLHQVWRQLFAEYYTSPSAVQRAFKLGQPVPFRTTRLMQVMYYRTRDEYIAALRPQQPRIDITLGIYFDNQRRACFFAGEEQDAGTLVHEAVHQLFQETLPVRVGVGRRENFWIVEGVATWFESLVERDGYVVLGAATAGRLPAARHRLLVDGFYVPFAELTRQGTASVQRHPDIAKLYSQIAGQTTFFMQGEEGRYRRALAQYIEAVYRNRANAQTLFKITGSTPAELDRQYRKFLQSVPEE